MLKATSKDKERIIEILVLAFGENHSVNHICGNDEVRIRLLMEYAYKMCSSYGKVFISEDRNACALVLFPDKKKSTVKSLLWDIKLALRVVGLRNVFNVLEKEKQIKKYHPHTPFYYLWFIGVHPLNKGTGLGSALLSQVIADAGLMERPIYLETSVLRNLGWYKRFGLVTYKELDFGYKLFLLKNNAPS